MLTIAPVRIIDTKATERVSTSRVCHRTGRQIRHDIARSVKARARWVEHKIYSIRRERTAEPAERQTAKAHAIAVLADWKRTQRLGVFLQIAALEQVDHYRSEPHHFSSDLPLAVG